MSDSDFSAGAPLRKRGRPKGKNRVPITQEERKARNAHYERERRSAYSSALNHLATVLECPDSMSGDDIIKMATRCIKTLTNTNKRESLDFLRHVDGLLNYQIEKLCPQLGITVDEIDNLEIGVLEASTNEVPEDILTKANAVSKVPDAHDKNVNVKDESTQLKTHNKKRGRKRRKLEASHNEAYNKACSSQESKPPQSGVLSIPSRQTISSRNCSDAIGRSSNKWPSSLEPLTSNLSTSPSKVSTYPHKAETSSLSSPQFPPISRCPRPTSSFQWMNSNAMLSNERMTSYPGSHETVSLSVTSPGSSSLSSISAPTERLTTSVHYAEHGWSNVSISQPRTWPFESVEPFTFVAALPEYAKFETFSPETSPPAAYPYEDSSYATDYAISSKSLKHESPSPESVISDGYNRNPSSCETVSYETASHEISSRDTDSPEIIIPESIMPQLLAYFPVWPTPESMPSTPPPNPELQWSSTEFQPVPQLQLQNQSLQPGVQPQWFSQQPYNCEPQTNFNNVATLSQPLFPNLEEQSAPVEHSWPTLSHESGQMVNNYYRQNDGLADSHFEELFANI